MKCPSCDYEQTKVVDSRISEHGSAIRRRRKCEKCDFRFTTFERAMVQNLMIQKKDGTVEPYDREKLEKSIIIACGKRQISRKMIQEKLGDLEEKWIKSSEVSSQQIGRSIVEMLKDIDEIAFIRFASVYEQYQDVETFKAELDKILKKD
jgi:transcriptional repressor NrdR